MSKHLNRNTAEHALELAGVALITLALGLIFLPLAFLFLGVALVVGVNLAAILRWHAGRKA